MFVFHDSPADEVTKEFRKEVKNPEQLLLNIKLSITLSRNLSVTANFFRTQIGVKKEIPPGGAGRKYLFKQISKKLPATYEENAQLRGRGTFIMKLS